MTAYQTFLASKRRQFDGDGLAPTALPSQLYDWQSAVVRWALKKGRAAIFSDCWRYGQKARVTASIVVSEAEAGIVTNVRRKETAALSLASELGPHTRKAIAPYLEVSCTA